MSVYVRFGVKPLINAAGTKTRLGGGHMAPDVLDAIRDSASEAVDMAQLQSAASRVIARVTGAEAGYVTSGASAGLTLSAAACMTGLDPAAIDRLPDTTGLRNEILIFRSHRNSYDHAWRAAGTKLVEIGLDDRYAGSGVRALEPWEIEAAVTDRTVAAAYVVNRQNAGDLAEFCEASHAHNLPVLVDAAGQLPPTENLHRFIEAGADLVAFSGGKAIGGPQGTGVLAGRRELIQAVLLNHLDMDMDLDLWDPPQDLLPRESVRALPHHGLGRGFKVGKEDLVGLLVALERFADGAWRDELPERMESAQRIAQAVEDVPGLVATGVITAGLPRVSLQFEDPAEAIRVYRDLLHGEPGIALCPADAKTGTLVVDTIALPSDKAAVVAEQLAAVVGKAGTPRRAGGA